MQLQSGDIINYKEADDSSFTTKIGCWGIRTYQKRVFGAASNWKDVHSMIYFDKNHIFSVEPPKTTYVKLKDIEKYDCSIYRFRDSLCKDDIKVMRKAADSMIGIPYDYGQLLDIGFQEVLNYPPYIDKLNIFDFSKKKRVCSVGVGVVYRALTKSKPLPKLFSYLNPYKWTDEFKKDFYHHGGYWRIEQYPPAIFANSDMFNYEFINITSSL